MTIGLVLVTYFVNYVMLGLYLPFFYLVLHLFLGVSGDSLIRQIEQNQYAFFTLLIFVPAALSRIPAFQRLMLFFSPYKPAQGEDLEKFQEALEPVIERAGLEGKQFNLYVNPDNSLNAFAIGDDNIVINKPLLDYFPEDEVTGILAHEMGHLQKGHTKGLLVMWGMSMGNRIFFWCYALIMNLVRLLLWVPFLGLILGLVFSLMNIILQVGNLLLNYPLTLFNRFCSRQHEYEADNYACELGLGQNLCNGLYRLEQYTQQQSLGFFARILSDHPGTPERLARIDAYVQEHDY